VAKIKVLIVDDQNLFTESLKNILEMRTNDLQIIGIAYNGNEAVELVQQHYPDVVLMDVRMPEMDGVEATRIICHKYPDIKIIMLTTFDDDTYVHEAMKYGALGYLLKTIPAEELITAIRAVQHGTVQISPSVAQKMFAAAYHNDITTGPDWLTFLSSREKEVLKMLGKGLTNRQIADRLFISEQTVKNHLHNIYDKVGVKSRSEAIIKVKEIPNNLY
jgi:DNA-binding NarL/FixJ family response regulator